MRSDFDRWLEYHIKAYPGLGKWLQDKANSGQAMHMERLLESYTVEQLSAATDILYAAEDQPRGYSDHGRAIKRLVGGEQKVGQSELKAGPSVKSDRLVADCPRCMDFGTVEVVSPRSLKEIWKNEKMRPLGTCLIACDCRRGDKKAKSHGMVQWKAGHGLLLYNELLDLACAKRGGDALNQCIWDSAREKLLAFDKRRRAPDLTPNSLP